MNALSIARDRPLACLLLVAGVLLAHGWAIQQVGQALAEMDPDNRMPERIHVRYVREMTLAPPELVVPPAARMSPQQPRPIEQGAPAPRRMDAPMNASTALTDNPAPPLTAASAPEALTQAPFAVVAGSAPLVPGPVASTPLVSASAGSAGIKPEPVASASLETGVIGPSFEPAPLAIDSIWPQSTRVSYTGHGYFRGEISGTAEVEWVRQGNHYQMHLDVSMGLFQRRTTSQGRIGPEGARPERYDESNKVFLGRERRSAVLFQDQSIELADGQRLSRPVGVQDTTSQFVQLTYLFTTQAERMKPGAVVEFPLAFPNRIRAYAYHVQKLETLNTPMGPIEVLHVLPRRVEPGSNDFVVEAWFAPRLNYLPIRLRIARGEDTHVDLMIARPPELAR